MKYSVSLSSAEAEYFGGMMAARDVIFLRNLLLDLGIPIDAPSVIQSDSKSAIDMSLDPVAFKKTKHILRAAEFLRDLVARDVVRLQHLPGKVMVADRPLGNSVRVNSYCIQTLPSGEPKVNTCIHVKFRAKSEYVYFVFTI